LKAAAQATRGVIWVVGVEGRFIGDSPSWRAFTGQTETQAEGRGWLDAVLAEDRPLLEQALADAFSTGATFELDVRVRRPNDRHTRARVVGVPVPEGDEAPREWVVSASEVWFDESVRRSEERLRLATEVAQVAVWEYDFLAGQMTRTENHDGLYGLPPQPVWTYDLFTGATHPDDLPMADQTVQASLAPGGPDDYLFDFRVIWPDGSLHWLSVSGHVFARDAEGRATLVRGGLIDVTRLKKAEAEQREAVRVRDEFLQIASHELRTPLTPLALKVSSLRKLTSRGTLTPAQLDKDLASAQRQVNRLTALVDDLLDVTRLSQGKLSLSYAEGSLTELVRSVLEELAGEAQRSGSTVVSDLVPQLDGRWDLARVRQVVENLVGNALKYGQGKPVHVTLRRVGDAAELTVRDEGLGIEPEAQPRIFQKFERAASARSYGGLGLGLYITRQLVQSHRGSIELASATDQGTTFTVRLPIRGGGDEG
jgi:PAS domain S-box-containing protein